MSVVFPPPPMMAVTPGLICSASDKFTAHTSLLFPFLKDNTRAVLRQEYRKNVDNPEPNMVKIQTWKITFGLS